MKINNHAVEQIHRELIEAWKLWLTWFIWFFGINFACIGWLITSGSPYISLIALILLVYHIGGVIASFGLSYHTYKIGKLKTSIYGVGFPTMLASIVAFFSGVNLLIQAYFWILFL